MRSAAAPQQNEQNDGADDGDEKRTETSEAIGKEGKHLSNYARALSAGLVNAVRRRLARTSRDRKSFRK
jgi:hypothetical protein